MNNFRLNLWLKIPFFNLLLVGCIGVILRYKIAFSLPFIDQKYLLHAHSHFAFSGWLSQMLMAYIVQLLSSKNNALQLKRYTYVLTANLVCAYGMLVSFSIQGYGAVSIMFSSLSVLVSYVFAVFVWKDLNRLQVKSISHAWIKAALFFSAISSAGAFALGYMMTNNIMHQELYLAAVYFFLHFQYNGWFFFASMGLLLQYLVDNKTVIPAIISDNLFRIFFFAAFPAWFLSALWLPMPGILYIIVVAAAIAQVVGLLLLFAIWKNNKTLLAGTIRSPAQWLWILCGIAFTIKIILQCGSTIPSLNIVAYGFRPIGIGYLHLVLLGVLSLFLAGYYFVHNRERYTGLMKKGLVIFTAGIIAN